MTNEMGREGKIEIENVEHGTIVKQEVINKRLFKQICERFVR